MHITVDNQGFIATCMRVNLEHILEVHPMNRPLVEAKIASATHRSKDSNGVAILRLLTSEDPEDHETAEVLEIAWQEKNCDMGQWNDNQPEPVERQQSLAFQTA